MPHSTSKHLDPRVRRTRKLLQDAFMELMAERPCDEIAVGDVTERAGVNRATFYAHYDDFQHFASEMLHHELQTALRARISAATPLSCDTLTEFGAALFEFFDDFYRRCVHVDGEKQLNIAVTLQETIHSFLTTWLRKTPNWVGMFPGSTLENVVTTLSWALYGGATRWSRLAQRPAASQAAREIVALFVR